MDWNNQKAVTQQVHRDGMRLQHASARLRYHTAVVTVAVSNNGMALQHAGGSAKKDRDVLLAAARQNGLALGFVDFGALSITLQLEVAVTAAQGLYWTGHG